jgi:ADP-ribosylglycohydrolase
MTTMHDSVAGGLYRLLIGDALGVPYEFHGPEEIPCPEEINYQPSPQFVRSHSSVPRGTWSDDGALALNLLASLLDCDRFDAEDFGRRLITWYDVGELAVDGHVFDVGIQTSKAIRPLRAGTPALEAGSAG